MPEITEILKRIRDGEGDAVEHLLREVYGELRQLAAAKMARESPGQTLQPTALVHEAWLKIAGNDAPQFENRRHFFSAAGETMRRILVDRARRRASAKHGGGLDREDKELDAIASPVPADRIIAVHEALEALESVDPLKAELVKLKWFVGLKIDEISETLEISTSSVERYWAYASAWLLDWIKQQQRSEGTN